MIEYKNYRELTNSLKDLILVKAHATRARHEQYNEHTDPEHLLWMLDELMNKQDEGQMNRWIGYVQGVLTQKGWTDVETERARVNEYLYPWKEPK